MRILHVSKYAARGGAALAALNSVRTQRALGADARLVVGREPIDEAFVTGPAHRVADALALARFVAERLPSRLMGMPAAEPRSLALTGRNIPAMARRMGADVIMLHNIDGVLRLEALADFSCPVVWRTHDMWPMTGTEHYPADPNIFRQGGNRSGLDRVSRWLFARKARTYPRIASLTICAPSVWLRDEMASSTLLHAHEAVTIPNGIDTTRFRPVDRDAARRDFGLPVGVPLILFGAASGVDDPRKGFDLLCAALRRAAPALHAASACLVTFGGGSLPSLPLPIHDLGRVTDRDRLSRLYAAADVAVVPSRMENLSLTVLEALACGTPVIAFRIGGMPDMVMPGATGWLVEPFDIEALTDAIVDAAGTPREANLAMRARCREVAVERFDGAVEAAAMLQLFERLVAEARRPSKEPGTRGKSKESRIA